MQAKQEKPHSMLHDIKIARPCGARWDLMNGNDQVRHCRSCKLNVYNISNLTRTAAENLIAKHEGKLCVRLYRRKDGTVVTRDCPAGLYIGKLPLWLVPVFIFAVQAFLHLARDFIYQSQQGNVFGYQPPSDVAMVGNVQPDGASDNA